MVQLVDITNKLSEDERVRNRALAALLMVWAKQAEEGRFTDVAIAAVCRDRTIDFQMSGGNDHNMVIAATAILHKEAIDASRVVSLPFKPENPDG